MPLSWKIRRTDGTHSLAVDVIHCQTLGNTVREIGVQCFGPPDCTKRFAVWLAEILLQICRILLVVAAQIHPKHKVKFSTKAVDILYLQHLHFANILYNLHDAVQTIPNYSVAVEAYTKYC